MPLEGQLSPGAHPWSDGLGMAAPVTGFVSLQGSISESSSVPYEVTFPARVLKSYSVRKAFSPLLCFVEWWGWGVRDKYGTGMSAATGAVLVGSVPVTLKVCPQITLVVF